VNTVRTPHTVFHEITITPQVFDGDSLTNQAGLQMQLEHLLKALCERGQLTSVLKEEQKKEVLNRISEMPDKIKQRIKPLLEKLKDRSRLVSRPPGLKREEASDPESEEWWLEHIRKTDQRAPFAGVICNKHEYGKLDLDPRYTSLHDCLDSNVLETLMHPASTSVNHGVDDYRSVLEPLLRFAMKVDIVDPYLNPDQNYCREFIKLVSQLHYQKIGNQQGGTVRIHTGLVDEYATAYLLERWNGFLEAMRKQYKHKYEVHLWKDNGDMCFHDRRILTNQHIGIQSDQSFRIYDPPKQASCLWSVLDPIASEKERERYMDTAVCFKRVLASRKKGARSANE